MTSVMTTIDCISQQSVLLAKTARTPWLLFTIYSVLRSHRNNLHLRSSDNHYLSRTIACLTHISVKASQSVTLSRRHIRLCICSMSSLRWAMSNRLIRLSNESDRMGPNGSDIAVRPYFTCRYCSGEPIGVGRCWGRVSAFEGVSTLIHQSCHDDQLRLNRFATLYRLNLRPSV